MTRARRSNVAEAMRAFLGAEREAGPNDGRCALGVEGNGMA